MERRPPPTEPVLGKPGFSPTPEALARASEALGLETPVGSLDELMAHIYGQDVPDDYEPQVLRPFEPGELEALAAIFCRKL